MSHRTGQMARALEDWTPPDLSYLRRAIADPAWFEQERREGQAAIDALFAPHEARVRAEQEARWTREEGLEVAAASDEFEHSLAVGRRHVPMQAAPIEARCSTRDYAGLGALAGGQTSVDRQALTQGAAAPPIASDEQLCIHSEDR